MGVIRSVWRSINSIGARVMLVVIVAGTVTALLAVAFVTRAMYSSAESGLVDNAISTGQRVHAATMARLEVVDVELRAAARLFEAGRAVAITQILSPFVAAVRVSRDGEVIDVMPNERARRALDHPASAHHQFVDGFLVVSNNDNGIQTLAVVEIADLASETEASRTWIGPASALLDAPRMPGLTVRRDGDRAIVEAPVGDAIVVYHEAALAPAKATVDRAVHHAVAYAAVVSLALLLAIAWALARGVTRPVRRLAESVRRTDAPIIQRGLPDNEIGELGAAIAQLRENLARDASLLQASTQFAHAVVHVKEPDALLAMLQQAIDRVHPGAGWRVVSIDELEAGASSELGIDLDELARSTDTITRSAQPMLVPLVADGSVYGVIVGPLGAPEVDLRHLEALAQTVVTAIRGLGLAELATINEKLAVIGRLSASIAHEMNNPLLYVLANLSMLEDELTGEPLAMATDARIGVERLTAIVKDLSRMSRRGSDVQTRVDLVELAREQIQITRARARRVEIELVADGPVWASCASGPIGQAVLNLIVNAIDAVRARPSPRVVVAVAGTGTAATITVSDNGEGIAVASQRKLFDAFFTTKGEHGTGLGLHLSRAFARSHGGDLALLATGPEGTSFRLSIPNEVVAATTVAAHAPLARAKVLVLDDEPLIVRTLERQLASVADVVATTDPVVALRAAATQEFSLVLCDWNMPTMSGAEFLTQLRRAHLQSAARFVVITGGSLPVVEGVTVLAKPLPGDTVRRLLDA